MRNFLESSGPRLSGGWFSFWAAVLLILPNCTFSRSVGGDPTPAAIFCDIAIERRCATADDLIMGTRLASAAVALVDGQYGTDIGLDDSPDALARCGGGPEAVVFKGKFPQGKHVCVNCGAIFPTTPPGFADTTTFCQAHCHTFFGTMTGDGSIIPDDPPTAETLAFCAANARASTNFPLRSCYEDSCTSSGTLRTDFADPRSTPDPVDWVDRDGVSDTPDGTLTRTAPTTGFSDAGTSSSQLIAGGDAYLEFTATETNTARTAGLSSGPPPPGGITFNDLGFGILLLDNQVHVVENGNSVSSFGAYASGDKFRVKLRENFDGTATVSFARVVGPCVEGVKCNEAVFHTSTNPVAYPVRADAMFREQGGTVTVARLVFIH